VSTRAVVLVVADVIAKVGGEVLTASHQGESIPGNLMTKAW
jgi:hypothetical protein